MARREAIKSLENGSGKCESLNSVQQSKTSAIENLLNCLWLVWKCRARLWRLARRGVGTEAGLAKAAIKIQGVLKG
jgi:hypothetical protein